MSNPWALWLRNNQPHRYNLASKVGWHDFVHSPPRASLELLTKGQIAALSDDEREDYNEARFVWKANLPTVKTAQLTHAFAVIDQVMASNRRDGDRLRGSVVIDAPPGLGKTTIAIRYARQFHRTAIRRLSSETAAGDQRIPVAFIPLDAGITLKGLNRKILAFYGHLGVAGANTSGLGALAVDCVRSCETQIIVIDDLHFIDFRDRHGREVSNHLKGLANEMAVTFIYVGVRLTEKKFFDEGLGGDDGAVYAQTARRATRARVAPFNTDSDASNVAWISLLNALELHLMLAAQTPGTLSDFGKELFRRTQGHIGSLTNLLDRAAYLAIKTGTEQITASILEEVVVDNAAQRLTTPKR